MAALTTPAPDDTGWLVRRLTIVPGRIGSAKTEAHPSDSDGSAGVEIRGLQIIVHGLRVDAERPSHADRGQLAAVYQAVHGHLRDPHQGRDLGDREELRPAETGLPFLLSLGGPVRFVDGSHLFNYLRHMSRRRLPLRRTRHARADTSLAGPEGLMRRVLQTRSTIAVRPRSAIPCNHTVGAPVPGRRSRGGSTGSHSGATPSSADRSRAAARPS